MSVTEAIRSDMFFVVVFFGGGEKIGDFAIRVDGLIPNENINSFQWWAVHLFSICGQSSLLIWFFHQHCKWYEGTDILQYALQIDPNCELGKKAAIWAKWFRLLSGTRRSWNNHRPKWVSFKTQDTPSHSLSPCTSSYQHFLVAPSLKL